ncbi:MAG: hypothetical protein ACO1NU_13345 [Arcticibacter sp.]
MSCSILNALTGEVVKCPVFVAVLPFSGYAYVEALSDAKLPQVVSALNHALAYMGGVGSRIQLWPFITLNHC